MNEIAQTEGQLGRASAVIATGIALSRITGLLRVTAVAAALGVSESRIADAYNLANTAPNILFELALGGVLASIIVPVMVELLEDDSVRAWDVASALITLSVLLLTVVTLVGMFAAPWLAQFYSSRLGAQEATAQAEALSLLLWLLLPQIVFYGVGGLTAGLLNAHRRFAAPTFAPVIGNVVVILIFIIFHQAYGEVDLSASRGQLTVIGGGTTLGVVLMTLVQLPFLRSLGHFRPTLSLPSAVLKKVLHLSAFVFAYVLVSQLGYVFMQWLANGEQGGYSAFVTGYSFFLVPVSLVGYSVTTALLPDLSSYALAKHWEPFRERLSAGIRMATFLLVPATIGLLVLGRDLLEKLLLNGAVTADSVALVWGVLAFLVIGLPQTAIFSIFVKSFYAMQDARTPFFLVTAIVVLHAAINIPLFAWLGVAGLALGQSIVYSIAIVIMGRTLSSRLGGIDVIRVLRCLARSLASAVVMGAAIWTCARALENWLRTTVPSVEMLTLLLLAVIGAAIYLAVARLLGADEVSDLIWFLHSRRSGSNGDPTFSKTDR